jgi:soluble lytic murein transglycosylase-like protein
MSAATLGAVAEGPADAAAAAQRVQQLQALLAQAQQGGSTAGFAAALEAASADESGESGEQAQPSASAAALTADATASGAAALPSASSPVSPTSYSAAPLTPQASASATPAASGSTSSTPYDATIASVASRYNIEPAILHGLIQQESGFDPNARSSAGALGLTQLMPGTASSLGVSNPLEPTQSIEGGARYHSEMLGKFGGNVQDALAAYNAGPGAVSQYGGVPPYAETQEYVSKVLGYANAYRQSSLSAGTAATSPAVSPSGSIA